MGEKSYGIFMYVFTLFFRFSFQTGNLEYPDDIVTDGVLEALPLNQSTVLQKHLRTPDHYVVLGKLIIIHNIHLLIYFYYL